MEVLVSFDSVMQQSGAGFILFPEIMNLDTEIHDRVNELGRKSEFVMYNLYLSDITDQQVDFIRNSFVGSFLFLRSEFLGRWILMTPYSKGSWESEHLLVVDSELRSKILKLNADEDKDPETYFTCPLTTEIQ